MGSQLVGTFSLATRSPTNSRTSSHPVAIPSTASPISSSSNLQEEHSHLIHLCRAMDLGSLLLHSSSSKRT